MGCASSSPMVQTTGSEMLKAATHVASDATKTAEDAVEGVKESVGKSLETAKDTVATTVESVKHEVENVVKEKSGQLDEAKNTLMEKLHLKTTTNGDHKPEATNTTTDTDIDTEINKKAEGEAAVEHAIDKTDMNELKTQLNEGLNNNDGSGIGGVAAMADTVDEQTTEHILTHTDTETDSLKTSTPEPEIEQALAKAKDNRTGVGDGSGSGDGDDDDDDNPPTPKPTLKELENLTAEVLKQQQLQLQQEHIIDMAVNNLKSVNNANANDDPSLATAELINNSIKATDNIKTTTSTQIIDSNTTAHDMLTNNDSMTSAATATATAAATTTTTNNDNDKINTNMHKTVPMDAVVHKLSTLQHPAPLLPLTLATTDIAFATATATSLAKADHMATLDAQMLQQKPLQTMKREEKPKAKKFPIVKTNTETEEKRPRTTEWEKFADMLALQRKFNPHDAFRRNGTLTKFGGAAGFGLQHRDRPSHLGSIRGMNDDDSSDTTSNFRSSPANSQRSSARVGGRVQRLPNRPNTGNNRKKHHEFTNGGGRYQTNRNHHNAGRKFDFNPNRSRTNDFISSVSSDPFVETSLQPNTVTTTTTQLPYAPSTSSHLYESVKSPTNMRSHHSRSDARQLPPLESQTELIAQQLQEQHPHINHVYDFNQQSALHRNVTKTNTENVILTRESSKTSLSSNGSFEMSTNQTHTLKMSNLDLRSNVSTHPPVKNTSSFLSTPRSSPFSIRKSYTDLYFSATSNKENKTQALSLKSLKVPQQLHTSLRDKSPQKVRKRCDLCSKKNSKK